MTDDYEYMNNLYVRTCELIIERLIAAAYDQEEFKKRGPAFHRMKLFQKVCDLLRQESINQILIESKFLHVIVIWLKPLGNHISLNVDIRNTFFMTLLQFQDLDTEKLKECKLLEAVMYLKSHTQEIYENKKLAELLINHWSY